MAATESDTLGGFRRLQVIGAGAQGKVWKARCVEDVHGIVPVGTVVALKVRYEHGDGADAQWRKTESRVAELKAMDHPNVVRYLGCFREKGLDHELHVVVQEFLEGVTLKERLDELNRWNPGRNRLGLDVDEALRIVSQMAAGLGYTASLGIFHRDVKPGNVFLCADGTAKLIDFGVARQGDGTVTEEGNIRGSWNYLAPDFTDGIFRGDQQSDIFSVGVVLHEIVTGRLPYLDACGDDTAAYFARWSKASEDSPVRIVSNTRRLLLGIDAVFDRTLTPDRNARYRDFAQLAKDLADVRFVEQRHGDRTYRRVQFVGEGGFGEVFKARWVERDEPVAVKMLKNADGAARFLAEADVMRELDGPCFTRFVDFFEDAGRAFLVMSFLDGMPGSSLRDAINRSRVEARLRGDALATGGMPKDLVLSAFERYARGLSLMHRHRPAIVHRDVKPSNLYCPAGRPDRVAIMDFGIVRTGDASTASGIAPCTFDYAPPEIVLTQDRGGPGMDVFALGLCMYEALTGKMGYPRIAPGQPGMLQFLDRCKAMRPPAFDDPRVAGDAELLALLRRMTDPDVSRRLTDADRVAAELRRLFYRDVASDVPKTVAFDAATDRTVAIDGDRLKDWFDAWRKANPVDERRLMEAYREQWVKDHGSEAAEAVRRLPRRSRWKTPLLMLACVAAMAAGVIIAWPYVESRLHPAPARTPAEQKIDLQLREARLKAGRIAFAGEFDDLLEIEPVATRRKRLKTAEIRLGEVVGTRVSVEKGRLFVSASPEAVRFRERLAAAERLAVGTVENRCGEKVEVDGRTVHDGESRRFDFEDGKPASRTVRLAGYEPRPLPEDFDGRTLVLKRDAFVASPVEVSLPQDADKSVTCIFEGRSVRGPLKLKPRPESYRCLFLKTGYEDKPVTFAVKPGANVRLPALGKWVALPVEVTRDELPACLTCTVDGKPAGEKVKLLPGRHTVCYGRRGYGDLVRAFEVAVGTPRRMPRPAEIGAWKMNAVRVTVPRLESGVRCRFDGTEVTGDGRDVLPGRHEYCYERAGYVAQTNEAFRVELATPTNLPAPAGWVAEKVRVTVPSVPGVEARMDGRPVSGVLRLRPGNLYEIEYRQTATEKMQKVSFFVQVNAPMSAPKPKDGDWVGGKPPAPPPAPPPPKPPPKPKPVVTNPVVVAISPAARKAYADAVEYYEYESYGEAFVNFWKAFEAGYPFSEEDLRRIEKSFSEERSKYKGHIEDWKRRPAHKDSHRNIEDYTEKLKELNRRHLEIRRGGAKGKAHE